MAKEPATFNDGRKVSEAIYDYCSYDSGKHTFKIKRSEAVKKSSQNKETTPSKRKSEVLIINNQYHN